MPMAQADSTKRIRDSTVKRFYGHETLQSKYDPQSPKSAEREYARITSAYMRIVKEVLESELPRIRAEYKKERDASVAEHMRTDSKTDLINVIESVFLRMQGTVAKRCDSFGIRKKLESMANLTRKLSVKEWKKAVKATLGLDIEEDYYLGEFYKEALESWIDENVNLINTIPQDTLDRMKQIVYDGFKNGRSTTDMTRQIQAAYGTGRKHAELIARDQIAKLNGNIQKAQQEDAGITEYVWSDCGDGRVRKSHKKLNGKTFKWSDPPLTEDGRRCHPGEDFQCRCIGRPKFNQNVKLPLKEKGVKITYR